MRYSVALRESKEYHYQDKLHKPMNNKPLQPHPWVPGKERVEIEVKEWTDLLPHLEGFFFWFFGSMKTVYKRVPKETEERRWIPCKSCGKQKYAMIDDRSKPEPPPGILHDRINLHDNVKNDA